MGIESNGCKTCYGYGRIMVRKLAGKEIWHHFGPKDFPALPGVKLLPKPRDRYKTWWNDFHRAYVCEAFAECPTCHAQGEPCLECKGDGKLHRQGDPDKALRSILSGTDEEPLGIINQFQNNEAKSTEV
jgi:hypothetical protein